ncbi:MAG: DUF1343 domain-containing protein [Pyrinomonadaceae bacterium]
MQTKAMGKGIRARGRNAVTLGLERLLGEEFALLRGRRVGLVCHPASVDHEFQHAADLLLRRQECELAALFGPQHGARGDVQDNMVETPHAIDAASGLPVYSLYSETRQPTAEMLRGVDVLVFDMQDVGCRIYTFIYTLANCMRAAQAHGCRVVVCDRPNPINGVQVAGNVLQIGHESFVGQFPLPTRHGMTIGELALMFKHHFGINCDLEVVRMSNWSRALWHDETDVPWVMPSPNMPTLETATVFPGTVHLEGTRMSEGRGTTRPFELVGAPYIAAANYAERLNALKLPGVHFRACYFVPTFQKHANCVCGGVQLHVYDRQAFEPVTVGLAVVKVARDLYPDDFLWKEAPYEYEYERNPFDVIAGTTQLRESLERGDGSSVAQISDAWQAGLEDFRELRKEYLLYA